MAKNTFYPSCVDALAVLLLFISLSACHNDTAVNKNRLKADLDTACTAGSGIGVISLDAGKIHNLTNLGMLWGFIKYYHASVNKGNFNMDAELFRVLPKVLAAHNTDEANNVMEQWVDHFGMPDTCRSCRDIARTASTKLMPDYGYIFQPGNLPASLISKLEFIKHNRDTGKEHYYIAMYQGAQNPYFRNELTYTKFAYPDAGIRLLALYRYWSMIQYFYPDRHLIGEDWNKVLTEFIPVFCNATGALGYEMACQHIIARIHDTHASLWGSTYALDKLRGDYCFPAVTQFIQNKLVVTAYYADSVTIMKQLHPGDIIEQVDGVPVDSLIKKYLPLISASNYSTQLLGLSASEGWILGGPSPGVRLRVIRHDTALDMVVQRVKENNDFPRGYTKQPYTIIPIFIGYIYPERLKDNDLDSVRMLFKNTKGIIIDMRCYPNTFMPYTYGEWFKSFSTPFCDITSTSPAIPGLFEVTDILYNGSTLHDGSTAGVHYNGKLVIIVNEETLSQAEFTAMAFATVPGALVIGDTTAGADGNVSEIDLPGGLVTQISGIGILYPDGSESQRVGVKIDRFIAPTIQGIREHRDEQLEYAIKFINEK